MVKGRPQTLLIQEFKRWSNDMNSSNNSLLDLLIKKIYTALTTTKNPPIDEK